MKYIEKLSRALASVQGSLRGESVFGIAVFMSLGTAGYS